jgi:hypothetical protein
LYIELHYRENTAIGLVKLPGLSGNQPSRHGEYRKAFQKVPSLTAFAIKSLSFYKLLIINTLRAMEVSHEVRIK